MAIRLRFLCLCGRPPDDEPKPGVPSSGSGAATDEYRSWFKPARAVAAADLLGVAVPDRPSETEDDPNPLCLANSCWKADMPG